MTGYLQAWFLSVDPVGTLTTDPAAPVVSVGATHAGLVRVRVPDGLDLAPDVAEKLAGRIAEAVRVARDPDARFAPGDDHQDQEGQPQ